MHLLLTDRLTCARCGPAFGLILLADRMVDRRVLRGSLGCPNCREQYLIEGGVADLRPPPRRGLPAPVPPIEPAPAMHVAAMLGAGDDPSRVLLLGRSLRFAEELSALLPEAEWVLAGGEEGGWPDAPADSPLAAASSRLHLRGGIPFRSMTFQGVVLDGEERTTDDGVISEASRVLASGGRLVVVDAGPGVARMLMEGGLGLLLDQREAVVAVRR